MRRLTQDRLNKIIRLNDVCAQEDEEVTMAILEKIKPCISLQSKNKATQLNLPGGSRKGKDLAGLDMSKSGLYKANLDGANLEKTNLSKADLYGASLKNANLRNANLCKSILQKANLSGANLNKADLSEACLWGADLQGATLKDAILTDANLEKAIGNGQEILTVYVDGCHINITDSEVWINECHHTWDEWMAFSDTKIKNMNMDSKRSLEFWRQWKPKLNSIAEERKRQRSQVITGKNVLGSNIQTPAIQ